jgi:hypothetical protein
MQERNSPEMKLSSEEVEKRLRAWADVTMLSLELKLSMLRKRNPELGEQALRELMRKEISMLKAKRDE